MRKIGILTLQYALNYGAVLQCFALKEVLRGQKVDPVIIDRIPDGFGIKYVLKRALVHPFSQKDFSGFRKHELRPITKPIYTSKELESLVGSFDACIVGSDQVWRKAIFSVNGDYFFRDINIPYVDKIAYAASLGVSEWEYSAEETKRIATALKKFRAISVREEDSVALLKRNCNIDAKWVLDPTLLAESVVYRALLSKSKANASGMVLTYILDWSDKKERIVSGIKDILRKPSIDILPKGNFHISPFKRLLRKGVSVYDWLKLFSTADYVVTDSFHGTVFSIIFNKPFYTIANKERGLSRFESLLHMFHLDDRLVFSELSEVKGIDFSSINQILEQKRRESLLFLKHSLSIE